MRRGADANIFFSLFLTDLKFYFYFWIYKTLLIILNQSFVSGLERSCTQSVIFTESVIFCPFLTNLKYYSYFSAL